MKVSELLNNTNLQYVLSLFPDLEYNSFGLYDNLTSPHYSTAKPKAKGLFENYELVFHGIHVCLRFFFEYKGIKVYYKNADPFPVGTNHQGKKIKNVEDLTKLQKTLIKEGYNGIVIEKALKEVKNLAIETPPIEKLFKDVDFTYNELSKRLTINNPEIELNRLIEVSNLLKIEPKKMIIKIEKNDQGECYFELEWK